MLKRKLSNGDVVNISIAEESGGVTLAIARQRYNPATYSLDAGLSMAITLNPVKVAELIEGLGTNYCRIDSEDGCRLTFSSLGSTNSHIELRQDTVALQFWLRKYEISFIRRALENLATSMMAPFKWCGVPEEL